MMQKFRETTGLGGGCGQCWAGLHQPAYEAVMRGVVGRLHGCLLQVS